MSVAMRAAMKAPAAVAAAKTAVAQGSGCGPAARQGSGDGPKTCRKAQPPITPATTPIILETSQFGRGGRSGSGTPNRGILYRSTVPHHPVNIHHRIRDILILLSPLVRFVDC